MGYYLTTDPQNAVPPKSWATPKTHVPGSPVKERGYRYYNPESGRWMSQDPIDEHGFRHVNLRTQLGEVNYTLMVAGLNLKYAFCDNRPSDQIDAFGLTNDPGDFGGPDLPPGFDYIPDPETPGSSEGLSCAEQCVLKHMLGLTVETTVIVSGQPVLKKRFVTPGSAEGTSIAGKITDAIFNDAKFPKQMPTLTRCCRLTGTKVVSRFVARWIPVIGWVTLTYDAAGLAGCICGCKGI